jgi:hypothetical protein
MQYFILLSADSEKDCFQETNLLGEQSFSTFYAGTGFRVLRKIIDSHPNIIDEIRIISDKGKHYTVETFLSEIQSLQIIHPR